MLRSVIDRTRRSHAVEHAAIALLIARGHRAPIAGYSTPGGFWVYGSLAADDVAAAARDALRLLRAGESELAISRYCGTNLAVGIIGAFLAASLVSKRVRKRALGIPLAAVAACGVFSLRRPLGMAAQRRLTTLSEVGGARVANVRRFTVGRRVFHRVTLRES